MDIKELRKKAEALISNEVRQVDKVDVVELLHELEVYQIELELQNEELRQSQVELETAKQHYFDMYMYSPVSSLIVTEKGIIEDANFAACELIGIECKHLLNKLLSTYISSQLHDKFFALINRVFKENYVQQSIELQMRKHPKTHDYRYVQMSARPYEDHGRHLARVSLTDVTQQHNLTNHMQKQASALNVVSDAVIMTNDNFEITYWNTGAKKLYGWRSEDVIGRSMRNVVPTEYVTVNRATALQDLTSKGSWVGEVIQKDRNGSSIPILSSVNRVESTDDDDNIVIAINRDISIIKKMDDKLRSINSTLETRIDERTQDLQKVNKDLVSEIEQRKIYEKELSDSERFLQSILDGQPSNIAILDQDGIIMSVNKGWRDFAIANSANRVTVEGKGLNYLNVLEQAGDVALVAKIRKLLNDDGDLIYHEYPCHSPTEKRWFEMIISRFRRNDGLFLIVSHTNITERKQLELEIEKALDAERELHSLKSRFVSMVSHEFRNPMAVILSSSDLLLNYSDKLSDDRRRSHLTKINKQIERLNNLLSEVSFINKNQIVGYQLNLKEIPIKKFLQHTIDEILSVTDTEIGVELFDHTDERNVLLDPVLIEKMFSNLISNAVKYARPNTIVTITSECVEDLLKITIKDEGIGIPEADQKYFFVEPFHRGTNVGMVGGTGLGHTIIKQAVDAHGGEISFTSREGVGTTFTVELPLYQ